MRDRNLPTPEQFNIQFLRNIRRTVTSDDRFPRDAVSDSPTLLDSEIWSVTYPRDFRSLRALSIAQWYFPENLHWRIWLDLSNSKFSWLNPRQRIILRILLSSESNCKTYCYESQSFSSQELFGNILRTDLKDALKHLKFHKKVYRLVPRVYRRGYRDKGARRPDHRWLPSSDYSLNRLMIDLEEEKIYYLHLLQRLLKILEKESKKLGF
jgi:hypothetical protein